MFFKDIELKRKRAREYLETQLLIKERYGVARSFFIKLLNWHSREIWYIKARGGREVKKGTRSVGVQEGMDGDCSLVGTKSRAIGIYSLKRC
jgi:hypothetical protein